MSIDKQIDILDILTKIMHNSAHGSYDEMQCEFTYDSYEEGWSVGSKYSLILNNSSVSELLDDPSDEVSNLVHQLHDLMKAHTGGRWGRFVLSVDAKGATHTKFSY